MTQHSAVRLEPARSPGARGRRSLFVVCGAMGGTAALLPAVLPLLAALSGDAVLTLVLIGVAVFACGPCYALRVWMPAAAALMAVLAVVIAPRARA